MPYRSNLALAVRAYEGACDYGLVMGARVVQRELVRDPGRAGYTSGAFVTGNVAASIRLVGPYTEDGDRTIAVTSDEDYAWWWETGHHNTFTGRFEREERWGPTHARTAQQQLRAMQRAARARLRAGPFVAAAMDAHGAPAAAESAAGEAAD